MAVIIIVIDVVSTKPLIIEKLDYLISRILF